MTPQKMVLDSPKRSETTFRRTTPVKPFVKPLPLDETTKAQIARLWRRGVSVEVLAQQHGRSASAIERVINEGRAAHILEQKLEAMYDPSFDAADAAKVILAPMPKPAGTRQTVKVRPPADLPPYLASLYTDTPLLSREQEAHLFRKMNYLKHKAVKLREALEPTRPRTSELNEIERLQAEALAVKNQIIRSNLRLVVSIAKKRVGPTNNFFELVSDGNMSLIRAVEKFDFARGFKFSTYASWAIMKNFAPDNPRGEDPARSLCHRPRRDVRRRGRPPFRRARDRE